MIKTIEDLFKYINTEDQIILMHKNYEFTSPLIIGNTSKIIGNGCELSGPLLICNDIIIENVTFSNSEDIINVRSDSKIKFTKCTFIGNSTNNAIILEPHSNSSVSLKQCTFSRFVSAISVNDNNSLLLLKNCIFQFCTLAIDKIVSNSYINVNEIKNNLMFNSKESIFLKFYESFNTYDYYNFCFELCNNNNFARIFGEKNSIIFDTISFYVKSIKELNYLLNNCSHCTTIFLNEGIYNLNDNTEASGIVINKSVNLIGVNSPTLTKSNEDSIKYAITINSSNVRISNFKIDGSENYLLRDAIHFGESGGANIVINNVEITRITRRGISFFGENTDNCLVKNCKFSYIKEQCAIYVFKNLLIHDCSFENLKFAIKFLTSGEIKFENNLFKNIYCCLFIQDPSLNIIKQKNNRFKFVENLVMLSNN